MKFVRLKLVYTVPQIPESCNGIALRSSYSIPKSCVIYQRRNPKSIGKSFSQQHYFHPSQTHALFETDQVMKLLVGLLSISQFLAC